VKVVPSLQLEQPSKRLSSGFGEMGRKSEFFSFSAFLSQPELSFWKFTDQSKIGARFNLIIFELCFAETYRCITLTRLSCCVLDFML
jgi:hypothetical protein